MASHVLTMEVSVSTIAMKLFDFADTQDRAGRSDAFVVDFVHSNPRKIAHVFKTFIVLFEVFKDLGGDSEEVCHAVLHFSPS